MDAIKCGKFIANKRKELNMTQAELAQKLNITDKAISRWERGLGLPDINLLENLSIALNVSIYELVKSEEGVIDINVDNSIIELVDLAKSQQQEYKIQLYKNIIIFTITIILISILAYYLINGYHGVWLFSGILAVILTISNLLKAFLKNTKHCDIYIFLSLSFALITLLSEYQLIAQFVQEENWIGIMDVVPTMSVFLNIATIFGIILNLIILLNIYHKKVQ